MNEIKTVRVIAQQPCVVFGTNGTSRNVEKGEETDWDASDTGAFKNGLVKPAPTPAKKS
jgi:hypothetical protein